METISTTVKVSIPNYLANLPIPNSVLGWFSLGIGDLFRLIPFGVAVGGGTYLTLMGLAKTPVVGPVLQVKYQKYQKTVLGPFHYYRTSSKRCLDSSRHRAILESGRRMARLSTPLTLKIWATREYFAVAGKAKSFLTVMDRITNIMKNVGIMLDL